jgi:predicted amidohydrolase YtcJ
MPMTTTARVPSRRVPALLSAVFVVVTLVAGCTPSSAPSPLPPTSDPSATASATAPQTGSLVLVGRIVTMDEPATADAIFIEDGVVAAIGTRDEVMAVAGGGVSVLDIGDNVAYPGFIDTHAHWIGDRNYYGLGSPAEAMDAVIRRGWTSISEQWDDEGKLDELTDLAAQNALPLRVDSYLALNGVHPGEHYGDWYADREPGAVGDRLRVQGLKIHLDNGSGAIMLWEAADLTATIDRANAGGWQISVHTVSTEAQAMVLDAFETAIGPTGPNPLHHRIEHALQVTDEQLARMVALDLVPVVQLDGVATDWVSWAATAEGESSRDYEAEDVGWLGRWRDFVDAGLHVAGSSDAPWFFPDFKMTDDIGRPVDQIAGGMDGRGREFPETRPWALDQLLTADQGLRGVTVEAAYALRDEARRGHLAPGTLGDVTVLSGDVTDATPDEIRAMTVIATIVGGLRAYCAGPEICPPAP